jgi:hypothetical protein
MVKILEAAAFGFVSDITFDPKQHAEMCPLPAPRLAAPLRPTANLSPPGAATGHPRTPPLLGRESRRHDPEKEQPDPNKSSSLQRMRLAEK